MLAVRVGQLVSARMLLAIATITTNALLVLRTTQLLAAAIQAASSQPLKFLDGTLRVTPLLHLGVELFGSRSEGMNTLPT